ncbi:MULTISPECIES: hypothetical protein [Enterococcus]|nr:MULTISPECIES: hypothetical protein [Enterococcus]
MIRMKLLGVIIGHSDGKTGILVPTPKWFYGLIVFLLIVGIVFLVRKKK